MLDLNRKMCVILTNGAQYQFTIRELFSLFTRKEFISLAFSMVCLMAILDIHSLAPIISAPMRLIHWAIIAVIYITLLFISIIVTERVLGLILPSGTKVRMMSFLPTFFAVVFATPVGVFISHLFGKTKGFSISLLLEDFALNFIVCLGMDAIFAVFVLPYIAAKNQVSQEQGEEIMEVFGEKLQLSAIQYLRADGRRTAAVLECGEAKISAKFSDVVERLPEQHGALVHRSFWVPYAQISELLTMDRRTICRLQTGQVLPVARSRYASLREELKTRQTTKGEKP